VEAIGRAELADRLASGELVVLDVRPRVEFAAGHIQGARSVPLDELEGAPLRDPGRRRGGRPLPRRLLRLRPRGRASPTRRWPHRPPARGRLARVAGRGAAPRDQRRGDRDRANTTASWRCAWADPLSDCPGNLARELRRASIVLTPEPCRHRCPGGGAAA
jgi:hypothetical protein